MRKMSRSQIPTGEVVLRYVVDDRADARTVISSLGELSPQECDEVMALVRRPREEVRDEDGDA